MRDHEQTIQHSYFRRWAIFALISSAYFLSYFHRVSPSVMAPSLISEFQIHATALGFMSSMFFYLYAAVQPVVGCLSDQIGPRKVIVIWSMIGAAGCFLFGLAPTIEWAGVGRALIGLGVGGIYVPALKAFSQYFREKEFSTLTGMMLAIGNIGAIAATTPLIWMNDIMGWRYSFFVLGFVSISIGIAVFCVMKNRVPAITSEENSFPAVKKAIILCIPFIHAMASFRFWMLAAIWFCVLGTFLTFQGLWATPYLMTSFDLTLVQAGNLNMLIPIGYIIGAPLWGWIIDRMVDSKKITVFLILLIFLIIIWAGLTLGNIIVQVPVMIVMLFTLGFINGAAVTTYWGVIRDITPGETLGITMGLLNPSAFFGVAIMQVTTGAILDYVGQIDGIYPPFAYRYAFMVCLAVIIFCFIMTLIFRKRIQQENC